MTLSRAILVGLIGSGIQGSLTPMMHEREGARQGLRYVYRLVDLEALGASVAALPELLRSARRLGFDGLNITHPCKQAIIPLLDALSPDAREIGAVNTVLFQGGLSVGHNTDWSGFTEGLRRQLPEAPLERVLQLGAGGAGAATAHALMKMGVGRLAIYDTQVDRAERLAAELCARHGAGRATAAVDVRAEALLAQGVVQATPVGMDGHPGLPLPADALRPQHWVAEIIYFPLETELVRRARALACRVADGSGMAVFQAVRAFEIFSGLAPDHEAMTADFVRAVEARRRSPAQALSPVVD